jgi:hypothetical protein
VLNLRLELGDTRLQPRRLVGRVLEEKLLVLKELCKPVNHTAGQRNEGSFSSGMGLNKGHNALTRLTLRQPLGGLLLAQLVKALHFRQLGRRLLDSSLERHVNLQRHTRSSHHVVRRIHVNPA